MGPALASSALVPFVGEEPGSKKGGRIGLMCHLWPAWTLYSYMYSRGKKSKRAETSEAGGSSLCILLALLGLLDCFVRTVLNSVCAATAQLLCTHELCHPLIAQSL